MKYIVNRIERNCLKSECECKRCSFNGIEGMCLGCTICTEKKIITPVSNCEIIKKGNWSGFCAVMLDDIYMISIPMGVCDIPEYFPISKEEFDSFDDWKDEEKKIIKIQNREYNLHKRTERRIQEELWP